MPAGAKAESCKAHADDAGGTHGLAQPGSFPIRDTILGLCRGYIGVIWEPYRGYIGFRD